MMDQFFLQMTALYTGAWTREQAPDPETEQINKQVWQQKFRQQGLTWEQVADAVDAANNKTLAWPNLAGFLALVHSLGKTERGLNHGAQRPAQEVMTAHTGARAHQLPPASEAVVSRRKRVGAEHLAAMRAALDGF
jgi:hypothetical protein